MSAVGGIRIRGMEAVVRDLHATARELRYATRIVTQRTAMTMRAGAREIVPGKQFDQSIQSWGSRDRATFRVGSDAAVAESVHRGRRPGEAPSIKALKRWIESRGLTGSVSVKTRRVTKRKLSGAALVSHDRAVLAMAYRLQAEIRARGTAPIPYLTSALSATQADLERYMREAVLKAIKKFRGGR